MSDEQPESTVLGNLLVEPVELDKTFDEVLPLLPEEETELEGTFTWQIDDWFSLKDGKYSSPRFKIGKFEWDVLLFPNGNRNKGIAIYLEPHFLDTEQGNQPDNNDWHCCAQFAIVLSRPEEDSDVNIINRSHHRFNATETDWGFANFTDQNHLKYPTKTRNSPLLKDGQLNITVYVRILKDPTGVLWHNFVNYDSKKITGYVGFKNQGATCYLNSLLQSYFFTKYFRKLVYEIPTDNESPNNSVPLALQKAFYQLQVSNDPLDTLELTRSFGWDSGDAFTQHDVQELNRILMDRLENKMKNTPVEGELNEIFVGKMKSFIKCIDVDYESSRVEDFWDLQLNVKNMKNLAESFDSYTELELMNGENQYAAQDYGLQDAEKGVIFEYLPPVLHLQLKRFEYDFNYDQLIKINDRYEFPESIDLSKFLDKDSKQKEPVTYNLHGVLVHAGDISTGHYYTMIKPGTDDKWFRFDDERVWRVTKSQVFEENFGLNRLPEEQIRTMTRERYQAYLLDRHTSAYMLVYIRSDMEEKLLQPVTKEDVPQHVIDQVEAELAEREKKEKEIQEAHLYVTLIIYNLKNFINYHGLDPIPNELLKFSYQDLTTNKEQPISLKIERTTKINTLCKQIKDALNIPENQNIRYWKMGTRQNNTIRLCDLLKMEEGDMSLEKVLENEGDESYSTIDMYIEEPYLDLQFLNLLKTKNIVTFEDITDDLVDDVRTNISSYISKLDEEPSFVHHIEKRSQHLVFVKRFEAEKQLLKGFGYVAVDETDAISKLAHIILQLINRDPTDIDRLSLFEEINISNINQLSLQSQFYNVELGLGDIITFEMKNNKDIHKYPTEAPFYGTLLEYYNFLEHRVNLRFSKVSNSDDDYTVNEEEGQEEILGYDKLVPSTTSTKFDIWIHSNIKYSELAKIVSKKTGIEPEYLKIFAVYSNGRFPLNSRSTLSDYLMKEYNCNSIPPFQYEELSIPLKDFEHLRPIKFYWLKDSYIHYQSHEFEVAGNCSVEEFLDKIQQKIGFTDEEKSKILLWTNYDFEFQGVLSRDTLFKQISKQFLIFGRILPDELDLFNKFDNYENGGVESNQHLRDVEESSSSISDQPSVSPTPDSLRYMNNPENDGHLVVVSQYFKDMDNKHGISFLFNLIPNEKFPDTRDRLHKKFGLGQKEFSRIKLGVLFTTAQGKSFKSLQNYSEEELGGIVLFDVMSNLDTIFMDHPDRLRSHNSYDRPMVIKN
ncbi:similar to Saccharomyces cerevisiae YMR304W UBP15 Ubiquitin-specific protease involved in protein deubiquitination [Maudiozyma saulgeensis]|uniref:ubiquitinyl hydrolase 1 n=1 Tax=Maudiozyma saulgeensis TaxID=1789683 RepID=A0A1X7R405_9SACH|nr:similar to Saccharomyces cerevisiae YMR304W UBP15 Ubiquitin-specific protease involved in protein deubiquitination [Kazachstania saulgeensis]